MKEKRSKRVYNSKVNMAVAVCVARTLSQISRMQCKVSRKRHARSGQAKCPEPDVWPVGVVQGGMVAMPIGHHHRYTMMMGPISEGVSNRPRPLILLRACSTSVCVGQREWVRDEGWREQLGRLLGLANQAKGCEGDTTSHDKAGACYFWYFWPCRRTSSSTT